MSLERLVIRSVEPFEVPGGADDRFERVDAVAVVALDPAAPGNHFVVDLDRARPDADGLVRFETDVIVIRPATAAGGRGRPLLYVVANRGLVTGLPLSRGTRLAAAPDGEIDAGDAWVLRRGMSVAWVGWQWDVQRRAGVVGIDVPEALGADGVPIAGPARLEWLPLRREPDRRLADVVGPWMGDFHSLAAADVEEAAAVLTVRDWFNGPRQVVDRARWRFGRDEDGRPVPDPEHVWLDGGFEARRHYELVYTTGRCPVAGVGLAAVRDVVSHLRGELGASRVLGFGVSQSGRWLRQFVHDSGNADLDGRPVFDGLLCHIAGGRRGEFNNRSAQPSTMNALGFAHEPPFSPEHGLFATARAAGTAPLTIFANSSTEYWRGDASLVHTSPDGADLDGGADWRAYLYAGAHHAAGLPPEFAAEFPIQLGANRVDVLWASRAHLAALDEWVATARTPPPNAVPRVADGTGRPRNEVLDQVAAVERFGGVVLPDPAALLGMPPIDLGPDAKAGIPRYPATVTGPDRPCVASAVDDDGNEVAGVRLPAVAVPLAAYTGWNPEVPRPDPARPGRHHPVEVWNLLGGGVAFEPAEIAARYGDRAGYLERVEASVAELVAARHLLAGDGPLVVDQAAADWDAAMADAPTSR